MREPTNLANAIVVIACMYFLIYESFRFWAKAGISRNFFNFIICPSILGILARNR